LNTHNKDIILFYVDIKADCSRAWDGLGRRRPPLGWEQKKKIQYAAGKKIKMIESKDAKNAQYNATKG